MAKLSESELPEESLYELIPRSRLEALMAHLTDEHTKALAAYAEYFDELRVLRRAINARPATRMKTFPWPGASNVIVPLIRIAGDAVKARIVNTILAPRPFWICSSNVMPEHARAAEAFLEWAVKNDVPIEDIVDAICDQVIYLGKCPVKVSWRQNVKKVREYSRKSRKLTYRTKIVEDRPYVEPILLENWLEPWGLEEPTAKPWNSQRVFLRWGDILERVKQNLYYADVAKLEGHIMNLLPQDMVDAGEARKLSWAATEIAELYETHVQYDLDGDGFREEIIVLWHLPTSTPLSARYNFFFHGQRPIEVLYYLRHGDSRSSGDGIAQLLFQLQEALSSFVNQRGDNITIANVKFWKGRKNVVKKGEQIWPGKVMLLEDPQTDLIGEQLGTVSPQSFHHESILRDYAERMSGIADPQLGREFDNPRVAATTTLSILQEGNRRFDMVVRLMRVGFSRIGLRVLQLYQQFDPRVPVGEILSPEHELYMRDLLEASPEDVERNVLIQVNTSSAAVNKETERQGLLALSQLVQQFYANIIQITNDLIANPQMPQQIVDMVIDMAQKSYEVIRDIVKSYDITDPERFLVDVASAMRRVRGGGDAGSAEADFNAGLAGFTGLVASRTASAGGNAQPVATPAQPNGGAGPAGPGMGGGATPFAEVVG